MLSALTITFILLIILKISGNISLGKEISGNVSLENEVGDVTPMYRLPDDTKPIFYELKMIPYLDDRLTFTGTVAIRIKVEKSTQKVYLHSKGLDIIKASIQDGNSELNTKVEFQPEDILILNSLTVPLLASHEYTLNITFKGNLSNHGLYGFYDGSYKLGSMTKQFATTQMEPTYARMAFPCYDEPRFKVQFRISLARYPHQASVSNMPLKSTSTPEPGIDGRVWDAFETSPHMPTYLVAFIVHEFKNLTSPSGSFSVSLREDAIDQAKYILEKGQILLKQMENFTGIKYLLPKMDLVGVNNLDPDAMENWGLIILKEKYLMRDADVCSTEQLASSVQVVAHEISHQWFGNYVTPSWWDYLWLSEGLANYFGHHLVAQIEPTWKMDQWYLFDEVQPALSILKEKDHPITNRVRNTKEIQDNFDRVTYSKAGSVIRMLEHIVSSKIFREALQAYLTEGYSKHNGSVVPANLWVAFTRVTANEPLHLPAGWTLRDIMEMWTTNRGHPIINVTRVSNGKMVNIIVSEMKLGNNLENQSWVIPVTCTKQSSINFNNTQPSFWIVPGQQTVLKDEVKENEWILCNVQRTGFYRVHYDDQNWELLINQLHSNHKMIHNLNRAQLIDDACALMKLQKLPYKTVCKLKGYLKNETDLIVRLTAITCSKCIYNTYNEFLSSDHLKNYVSELITPLYNHLGFKNRPHDDQSTKRLRSELVSFACELGLEACVTAAKKEYKKNELDLSRIDPDVKVAVLCTMLRTSSGKTLKAVGKNIDILYKKSKSPWEKETIEEIFRNCKKDIILLKRYLTTLVYATDNYRIPRHRSDIGLLEAVSSSPHGVPACLEFIRDTLSGYKNLTEEQNRKVIDIVRECVSKTNTEEQQKELRNLLSTVQGLDQEIYGSLTKELTAVLEDVTELMAHNAVTAKEISNALMSM